MIGISLVRVKQLLRRQGQSTKNLPGQIQGKLMENGTKKDAQVKNLPVNQSRYFLIYCGFFR